MRKIDQFFSDPKGYLIKEAINDCSSRRWYGKSALLTMLKLLHLTSFWPKDKECILKKLGPQTLIQIRTLLINSKLFFYSNSLDEDPRSYGRTKDRLMDILEATQHFHRVIINMPHTVFPNTQSDPFERPGIITIGGFVCPTKYLSFFLMNTQVEVYLRSAFRIDSASFLKQSFAKRREKLSIRWVHYDVANAVSIH